MRTTGLGLMLGLTFACGHAQAQQAPSCQVRLAVAQYQLKNPQDATSPENFTFGSLPLVEKIQEVAAQHQICLEAELDDLEYTMVWEKTPKGFKGELYQHLGDDLKTVAATEAKSATELVETLFDSLVVYAKGLGPKPGESEKHYVARLTDLGSVERCKVYFAVYWADEHIPGGYAPGMHHEQKKWYEKKLAKKYPSVCLSEKNATYAVIWSSEFKPFSFTLPVYHQTTTTVSGDVNATATTGSWENKTFESKTNNVYMFVFPLRQDSGTLISPKDTPLYATHQESWWTYRAAHREALEDTLRFLDSLAKP
jgi:hypothetical protein